ncbi:Ger(x)C family spore germination protein [Paenibacillus sp. MMS20-IR301]|uniref:Ger(x)C family spore germination protein n=1 Tax=Paenibacillus sp. MMS20-IR301 TaxID=2895946 RepID=UPI0028E73DC8|nr:Ger(x)C family spore germination protein [Paenibacillus sp. MMS20-IR301]WNS44416.1 Ger(x)C family spore germination protein [Paenibacillus sp. MMS20-IR301]
MDVKRILQAAAVAGIVLLLTGCWNSRELNELAIVSGIGIDLAPGGDEYKVTFQLVNPSSTATSTAASTGQPSIVAVTATDRTLFGALRQASKKATRQLFFAHTQLVVLGESLSRSGINNVFDIFERSHELRLNSAVLIAHNSDAASILKILTPVESLPSMGMVKKTQNTSRVWGENRLVQVFDIINGITGEGDLTINGVYIKGDPEEGMNKSNLDQSNTKTVINMNGLGVFRKGKLIYWIKDADARGTQWLLNKIEETVVNVDADDKKESVAVNIFYSKTSVKVELRDGLPVFHVNIREEGIVNETDSYIDLSKREEIIKLQKNLQQQTESEVKQAFKTAQQSESDIFNFGNELKRNRPEEWALLDKEWGHLFAQGKLDLQVEAYIRSTGMSLKPYIPPDQ